MLEYLETQNLRRALIIVDMQEDFVEGGNLAVQGGRQVAENIASNLLSECYFYDLIVTTQDWHINPGDHFSDEPDFVDSWPVHCVADSDGARILPIVENRLGDLDVPRERILKGQFEDAYSGFMGSTVEGKSMAQLLQDSDISIVDVVGVAGNYCVKSTAIDSARAGFVTRILNDYVAWIPNGTEAEALQEISNMEVEVLG